MRPGAIGTNAVLFAGWLAFMLLVASQSVVFGSRSGNWFYEYCAPVTDTLVLASLACAAVLTLAYWISDKLIERFRAIVVVSWLVLGVVFHVYARGLHPTPLPKIIKDKDRTSYYIAAKHITPGELLSNFEVVSAKLPLHAGTNMPGKLLMFQALLAVRKAPRIVGQSLIAIAGLAGLFVYAVAERWLRNRRAALLALVSFIVMPGKLNFMPHPNTITPLFVFLSLWLLLVYLDRLQIWVLVALGVSLYLLFIFEPLPFVLGLLFVGAILQRTLEGRLTFRSWWKLVLFPLLGFAATHFAMKLGTGFDALRAFQTIYEDATHFNEHTDRPYGIWAVQNLIDFAISLGFVSAMILAIAYYQATSDAWALSRAKGLRATLLQLLRQPATNMFACLFLTLLIVDLWGVNRGETQRLWLFIAAAVHIALAGFCLDRMGQAAARLMVATCAIQGVITTAVLLS